MRLNLQDLDPAGIGFDEPIDLAELSLQGEERAAVHAARIVGRVRPGPWGPELEARLTARVELECSRCLAPCSVPIDVEFALILVPEGAEPGQGDRAGEGSTAAGRPTGDELPDPELFFAIRDSSAALDAIAREQLYLNLPLKPVCSTECRGLCPTCGVNRNRIECACPREPLDPRLAPLLEFRKRLGRH